ncbi:hypothetical protein AAVH_20166 [Aphelenchoides avenae]|nr:hypothetical protein AAVH_20166 [Aphelenchus avenae]
MPGSIGWHEAVDFAVEKFHVSSKCFRKRLTVELHRRLVRGTAENEREQSCMFHKIKIRLVDEICSPEVGLSGTPNRSSATPLLLPEFASDVLGYLDRAYVGSSLLSNRGLHNLICQLKQRLPVHHLKCAFEEEMVGPGCVVHFSGAYWLEIRHLQRDLPYTNVRFFKLPSTSGAALIRHYLSNSHVDILRAPTRVPEFPFVMKMLASLTGCNVTAGRVKISAGAERLSDYRSMDAVFGELRMSKLSLTVAEHRFVELVKTADFFRMSSVQRLQELKLTLTRARDGADAPKGRAESKSPLWVSGIYLLRSCQRYRVDYESDRHLRSIERKMVQTCEAFERGEITDTVDHFEFATSSSNGMNYAFKRDNLLVSRMKVEGKSQWDPINKYEWNVYRFRNASTNEYLTACVGQSTSAFNAKSLLHISKGEVYPDASFAYF